MPGLHHSLIQLLILTLLNTGVLGESQPTYQYNYTGDDVQMPCKNLVHLGNCSSIKWIYFKTLYPAAIEEVSKGKVNVNSNRAERLRLEPDCSLTVNNVTSEDAGTYTCREGNIDTRTFLSLLTISSSTPKSDLMPDHSLTLWCILHTHRGAGVCKFGEFNQINLKWVDQTGTDLHGVPRYQVIQNDNCNATLKVTLRKEDDNRKWTCELTQNGHVKSFDFLVTFPGVDEWVVIKVVIRVVVSVAVFAMITALVVIFIKKTIDYDWQR